MDGQQSGPRTFALARPVHILGCGSAVGRKEADGPLGEFFDFVDPGDLFGQSTFEQAERAMMQQAIGFALESGGQADRPPDLFLAGDLLNQCITASFTARSFRWPYLGLYNACSTFGEGLIVGSCMLNAGAAHTALAAASSHFCTAERQYRTPLEYGGQRPPTTQWTVTGAGAALLGLTGSGPVITHATVGTVTDLGITDANNMGAAMAPVDVKLAPYPEKTRQYKIQLFSTKYDCFQGDDMVFRIESESVFNRVKRAGRPPARSAGFLAMLRSLQNSRKYLPPFSWPVSLHCGYVLHIYCS